MQFKKIVKKHAKPKTKDLFLVNQKTKFWKPFLLMTPAIAILILFTVVPFIFAVKDGIFMNDDAPLAPPKAHINNFTFVLKDKLFHQAIKNSIIYSLISVPLILIISVVISSAIASVIRKRLRGFLQTIFFLPYVTSAISIALAFTFLFDVDTGLLNKIIEKFGGQKIQFGSNGDLNPRDSMIVMTVYGVWRGLAFNILIFTTAMLSVDKNKYKAAAIDGAKSVKQFFNITLPSINRTTNFLITIGIIGSIKVFTLALFNNNVGRMTSGYGITLLGYVYAQISWGTLGSAGVASLYLLIISICFSLIVKGGINNLVKLANKIGEKRVENKIKNYEKIK